MSDVNNVTASKPAATGGLRVAPYGTALPTDATTALDAAYVTAGYVSEDGFTRNKSISTSSEKSWGGDTIFSGETGVEETYKIKLCEELSPVVHQIVDGDSNVVTDSDTSKLKAVYSNSTEHEAKTYVIEEVLKGGAVARTVIPNGTVTSISEVAHKPGESIKYEVTISALPDSKVKNASGVACASVTYYA